MTCYDLIIVGQGLVGSLLAWRLHHAGLKILVIDSGEINASRVAAGLVTPITGKRWVLTESIEEYLPQAKSYYQRLEQALVAQFWHEHPTLRLYHSEADRQLARRRLQQSPYQNYLGEELAPGKAGFGLADPFGSRWLLQTARLSTCTILESIRRWLRQNHLLREAWLDPRELLLNPRGIRWKDIRASELIFCEGWRVIHNPWFGALPWQPSRGQILRLECQPRLPPFPVNRGIWLLPESETQALVGATYRWDSLTTSPDPQDTQRLMLEFARLLRHPPQCRVLKATVGIRPNTLDHHPIVGRHPRFSQLLICNGMGSKASLYAPRICQQLCDHMLHLTPLPAKTGLQRYHAYLLD